MLGARGARFHMLPGGAVPWEIMHAVAERIAPFGWHIQLQMNGRDLVDRLDALLALPTPLVVDHVGSLHATGRARRRAVRGAAAAGRHRSLLGEALGAVRIGNRSRPTSTRRSARLARSLVERAPERMLWATNWPHPGQADPPALADLARLAFEWMPDDDDSAPDPRRQPGRAVPVRTRRSLHEQLRLVSIARRQDRVHHRRRRRHRQRDGRAVRTAGESRSHSSTRTSSTRTPPSNVASTPAPPTHRRSTRSTCSTSPRCKRHARTPMTRSAESPCSSTTRPTTIAMIGAM